MNQLLVPYDTKIANLFPDHTLQDGKLVLLHDTQTTFILRRFGMDVPAPVHTQYKYSGTRPPFEVQKSTVELLTMNQHAYVLSGMGVGKTACPLWAYDYLRGQKLVGRMLIVAPLSTLDFVWRREMFLIGSPYSAVSLHGTKAKRLKLLAEDHDIYIINHDGVGVIFDELMKRKDIDTIVIDELAEYRNKSDRTKLMKKLAARMKWVWGMTGAPAPNAPTDVWNQANIVTPHTVPPFFGRYREDLMVKIEGTFKWIPKHDAAERAFKALQPSVRYTLEDVGELPPYISRRIDVPLGPRQHAIYEAIRKDCIAVAGADTISAANKGVLLSKLLQISLGYVYSQSKGIVTLDNDARLKALRDILMSGGGQVLIFTAFKHALAGVSAACKHDGWEVAEISGDVAPGKRTAIFNDFQNNGRYKAIVAHPDCMSHGLTLTAADTIIWFGPITSLDTYDQVNARIRRTGQTKKQQFLHLQSTKAEKKLYDLLIAKQNVQNKILSLFEED